jgi:hypothetical protein
MRCVPHEHMCGCANAEHTAGNRVQSAKLAVRVVNMRQRVTVNIQRSMLEERGPDVCTCEAMTLFCRIRMKRAAPCRAPIIHVCTV